ncbi:nicotinamide riboside transporter PnuC [Brumimicrobium oceani]|uniref:Nicotinamide riboside transporter PnuC n=1 Tax=Brumimicrobium oceani TaxID=2100725 RepID=A0A2U2XBY2_9FLAO|nr:nicotinamide riboside transporter PnuC [Brumimicrobium oceani]PWH85305.1 nicotinamide riboside transporter PnuC [Brumimicrobium oceani]
MEIINEIIQGLIDTSALEWAGVIIGTFYLIFIARKNRFGWLFAMVSTSIYIYLTYSVGLYIESGLQIFYFVMAIYGWASWNKTPSEKRLIIKWPIKYHIINILVSSVVTLLLGFIMAKYTDQKSPYLDAFSTVFSLVATFMVAQRVLENWIYWIVIDAALIFLYADRGFYLTGFHYLVYTIIAIFAFFSWYKLFKAQKNENHVHRT